MDICSSEGGDLMSKANDLPQLIAESGLLAPVGRTLVLLSGGGDSVAQLDAIVALQSASRVVALHVNYGLRGPESDADEVFCRELCERLDVRLIVEKFSFSTVTGNLHQVARDGRYELAQKHAESEDCTEIAVAHTADDQAETVLYRLFASPGRRPLLGMQPRRGNIVRPLLGVRREVLRDWCRARGLEWREDSSNADDRFARTRVRGLLDEIAQVHPAAIDNILASARQLREEGDALDAVAAGLLARAVGEDDALDGARLAAMPTALAALVLRMYVEERIEAHAPAAGHALGEVLRLCAAGGSHEVQLEGVALSIEYGSIRVATRGANAKPEPVALPMPGIVQFGGWSISAGQPLGENAESVSVAKELADAGLTVRTRNPGDRISPAGMKGSKTLQDLFVDRKVPRRLRDLHPVICAGEAVLWVPGVAAREQSSDGILLNAIPPANGGP
jgi:tRNA(Ile)-lysidine synthase